MKVLHVSSESGWRGGEQQLAYLLEELLQQGIQCVVICRRNSAFKQFCLKKSIPCHALPLKNSLDISSAIKLKQICQLEKPDLVHVHSSRGHAIVHLAQLLGLRIPQVLTRRVAFPIAPKVFNVWRYNSRHLYKIICISNAVLESTALVVENKNKLEIVYSGIDLGRFTGEVNGQSLHHELGLPDNAPLIGTVAALTAEKDLATFVTAAQLIAASLPEAHFIVAGEGPEQPALNALAEQLQIKDKMHFIGRRNNIPQLLPQLKLFMFTSKMEGLGTSVLDAFACRVPVVATAAGGVPEIVRNEETGLLAPIGDASSLASAAISVLQEPDLQRKFTTKAYSLLTALFTKEQMAAETLQIYQQVLSQAQQVS